ncbi:MAG: hypothetical protein ABSC92_08090 [Rhizomicrobium sp.]
MLTKSRFRVRAQEKRSIRLIVLPGQKAVGEGEKILLQVSLPQIACIPPGTGRGCESEQKRNQSALFSHAKYVGPPALGDKRRQVSIGGFGVIVGKLSREKEFKIQ